MLQILNTIHDQPGIVVHQASELTDLEIETKSEDMLAEIERLQQRALSEKRLATGLTIR